MATWKLYTAIGLLVATVLIQGCSRARLKRENAQLRQDSLTTLKQYQEYTGRWLTFLDSTVDVWNKIEVNSLRAAEHFEKADQRRIADDNHWRTYFETLTQLDRSQAIIALLLKRNSPPFRRELQLNPPTFLWYCPDLSLGRAGVEWLPENLLREVKKQRLDEQPEDDN